MLLLFSVKPHYAAAIFEGRKVFEYRRSPPRRYLPGVALIYETLPVSAVTGAVKVEEPFSLQANDIAELEPDIAAYLAGARAPCAIPILVAKRFGTPIPFRALLARGVRAPQSWTYVATDFLPPGLF
ncbi:hypothetical protein EJC47_10805 [Sphingomonas sp. TF3]|uniref:hypothetical protein n=1 Tax=Sphingomonas sp. TF3 TaxID=2495580 RepID=UPI000F86327F|nr:hypothetical protein [Sphingomonas sp. TF3]RUN76458.1 hypothetical protein EJC47_10805 [Sphingomonas sp. TF3]